MVTTIFRVLFGTFVYTIIIALAAPFPSAAGLFLTFPALNGLGFFYSARSDVEAMAKSMLWLPVINGALCAAYIVVFLALNQGADPTMLAWVLAITVALVWLAIAFRKPIRDGIAQRHQLTYAVIVLLAGCALVAIAPHVLNGPAIAQSSSESTLIANSFDLFIQILWQSKLKNTLFASCLLFFLVLTAIIPRPPDVRGILAGLPIVPFGGLVSVAGDSAALSEHLNIFERMAASVGLAPAVAVWFIYGYSKYLTTRKPLRAHFLDAAITFAALLGAWFFCGLAIIGIAYALSYIGQPGTCPGCT